MRRKTNERMNEWVDAVDRSSLLCMCIIFIFGPCGVVQFAVTNLSLATLGAEAEAVLGKVTGPHARRLLANSLTR